MKTTQSLEKKKISLLSAVFFSSTCMIGSGWLFSAQLNACLAGTWGFVSWIIAAVLVLLVGLCFTTIIDKYPVRGATTRSSALSHNHVFGMPFAFANWFGILVVIPSEAQATTQYLASAIGDNILITSHGLNIYGKLFSMLILCFYLLINFFGIRLLSKINNMITVFKVCTPIFIIIIFLIAAFGPSGHGYENMLINHHYFSFKSIFPAIAGAGLIYSFNGFQICLAFSSEIKNPKKNIPLAIILSISIVLLLYMTLQFAFMNAIPQSILLKTNGFSGLNFSSPLLDIALLLGFNFASVILLVDSVVSPSGAGYTYLGAATRMTYGMAKERQLPRWLANLDITYNFSRRSLIFNFIITLIILYFADSWAMLMTIVTGFHIIGYMAAPISMAAIAPSKRLYGLGVFILLGLLLYTLKINYLLSMNIALSAILALYSLIQIRLGIKRLAWFVLPFVLYIWLTYELHYIYCIILLSVLFYCLVTHKKYVSLCKKDSLPA